MRMVDREYAFLVSSSRKDIRMQRGFPHHRFRPKHPGRRPMGGAGLVTLIAGVNPVPKTEPEYCRRQAERIRALAEQCPDPTIRDQVEAMGDYMSDVST